MSPAQIKYQLSHKSASDLDWLEGEVKSDLEKTANWFARLRLSRVLDWIDEARSA